MSALDRSDWAAALIDEHDRVVFFSRAAERLWGLARDEVLGQDAGAALSLDLSAGDDGSPPAEAGPLPGSGPGPAAARKDSRQVRAHVLHPAIEIDGRRFRLVLAQARDGMDAEDALLLRSRRSLMAIDHANRPMLIFDARRRIVHVNRAFTEMFGYEAAEVLGRDPVDIMPSPTVSGEERALHRSLPWGRERFHTEVRVRGRDGREHWIRISSSPFGDDESDALRGYSVDVLDDVTEERQIRGLERDVLQALTSSLSFEDLGDYLCRRIESIAPRVRVSVCRIAEDRMRPWAGPSFPPEYGAFFEGMAIGEGVASCGTAARRGEPVMVRDIATDPLWGPYKHVMLPHGFVACWTYPVKRRDGSVAATFAFYFKEGGGPDAHLERIAEAGVHLCVLAIEREESRQQMARLVQFDALTGLPNRSHLLRHVDDLLAAAAPRSIAFFVLDLDRFTDITDALGHAAGDQALVTMANRLQGQLQPGQFLGRTEDNLFVIVASGCDVRAASLMAERLQEIVGREIAVGGHRLHLSASVGISHYPEGGLDRDALLANARNAMSRVKEAGGGGYQFFSPEMNRVAQDRLLLGAALKRAIAGGGLSLHYQPQILTDGGALHGFEALARWDDAELGDVPPARFIGLAEETGQIEAIGRWALREACRQLAQWRAAGMAVPTVSVNLSPMNFHSRDLPEFVAGLLREFALSGASLTIEITESTMVALTPQMQEVVHGIRALGVGLSVDDFGTGFSSLSNLVNLPVTEVKIDRSFVDRCLEEDRLRSLIAAVVGMGRSLGLTVVAEGVETPGQRRLLDEHRCPVLQGYLFARPLAPREAQDWFREYLAEGARHREGLA